VQHEIDGRWEGGVVDAVSRGRIVAAVLSLRRATLISERVVVVVVRRRRRRLVRRSSTMKYVDAAYV